MSILFMNLEMRKLNIETIGEQNCFSREERGVRSTPLPKNGGVVDKGENKKEKIEVNPSDEIIELSARDFFCSNYVIH